MQLTTFLMFSGRAEEAMNYYVGLIPNSRIVSLTRYGTGELGKEGSVKQAMIEVAGVRLMCIDSPVAQPFTFTPSISLFLECDSTGQLDQLHHSLNEGGHTLMPPNAYGFSTRFAWVQDRFGVSWQLNVA